MKNALRISLTCLFMALSMNVAFYTYAQTLLDPGGADLPWLQIHTRKIPGDKFIHPERTEILTTFEPVVSQVNQKGTKNQWVIRFNIF